MAATATLQDNFDSNTILAKWTLSGAGTPANQIKCVNSEIEITTTGTSGNYELMLSTVTLDLTGSYIFCQLVSGGAQAANQDCGPLYIQLDGNNKLWITVNGGNIQAVKLVATVQGNVGTSFAYDTTIHKWFRIRESAGTCFWDYSTDGINWVNWTSLVNPFAITAVTVGIQGGQFGAAASTVFKYDNFNIQMGVNDLLMMFR